jgi:hypothetical protein
LKEEVLDHTLWKTCCKTDYRINEGMTYIKEEYKHPNLHKLMLQNHHALSKHDNAETCSAMTMHSMKETVLLRETINSDIYVPFTLVPYFRNNSS